MLVLKLNILGFQIDRREGSEKGSEQQHNLFISTLGQYKLIQRIFRETLGGGLRSVREVDLVGGCWQYRWTQTYDSVLVYAYRPLTGLEGGPLGRKRGAGA